MSIPFEHYFSEHQLTFVTGSIENPIIFPQRSRIFTSSELWRALGKAYRSYQKRSQAGPHQMTADRVNILSTLRDHLVIEDRGKTIAIQFLAGGHPKVTAKDVVNCHIYFDGRLALYNEVGEPATSINADTHLCETAFFFSVYNTERELISAVRWSLQHIVDEITKPCPGVDLERIDDEID